MHATKEQWLLFLYTHTFAQNDFSAEYDKQYEVGDSVRLDFFLQAHAILLIIS